MEIILIILGGALILALSSILRGYVLTWLWLWFIVPVFHLPELGIVQAIGISAVVGFLTTKYSNVDESELKKKTFATAVIESFCLSLAILGIGYLVKLFL